MHHLVAFGLNHQTAPLSVRERCTFPAQMLPDALANIIHTNVASEVAIVSTCNRTEIYCNSWQPRIALEWLACYHGLAADVIRPYLYQLNALDTVRHAFKVACGLDSMVLGETQILGQFKAAVRAAEQVGTLGCVLHALFQKTFSVAKEVRSKTTVGAHSVSMAAAAVKLAEKIFPTIGELNVLFIGAGKMTELVATHFAARAPTCITVANRTLERGYALAKRVGGNVIALSDLPSMLSRYDVVVASTSSPLPIIGKGLVERAVKLRRHRPIFMLDLAVPRDIEQEVGTLADVFLYTVDDIASLVEVGLEARQTAAEEANTIIEVRVSEFIHWLQCRDTVPTIRALRAQAERIRCQVLGTALKQLARGDDPDTVLEALSIQLTNKLMHSPTRALSSGRGEDMDMLHEAVVRLYQIYPET